MWEGPGAFSCFRCFETSLPSLDSPSWSSTSPWCHFYFCRTGTCLSLLSTPIHAWGKGFLHAQCKNLFLTLPWPVWGSRIPMTVLCLRLSTFPALGTSGHAVAVLPSSGKYSVAAGPNHHSHWRVVVPCSSWSPQSVFLPHLGWAIVWLRGWAAGRSSAVISWAPASETVGSMFHPQRGTLTSPQFGTICQTIRHLGSQRGGGLRVWTLLPVT